MTVIFQHNICVKVSQREFAHVLLKNVPVCDRTLTQRYLTHFVSLIGCRQGCHFVLEAGGEDMRAKMQKEDF